MTQQIASSDMPTAPIGVRIRARLLGMRVSQPWQGWAEQDVRAATWPVWCGVAVTLWGAVGFLLALAAFRSVGEPFGAGEVVVVAVAYGFVIAMAVGMAHTESGRRRAIERLRHGWRAQHWSLAVGFLGLAWFVVWLLYLRPGA